MPPIAYVWGGIGATFAVGYWMLSRAIKFQEQEMKEKNRKAAEDLAKP